MYYYECPKCWAELSAEVDVGEHLVDLLDECDECNYLFTEEEKLKLYEDALTDGVSSMVDRAHDMAKDRACGL